MLTHKQKNIFFKIKGFIRWLNKQLLYQKIEWNRNYSDFTLNSYYLHQLIHQNTQNYTRNYYFCTVLTTNK